jgi:hypothetical protein
MAPDPVDEGTQPRMARCGRRRCQGQPAWHPRAVPVWTYYRIHGTHDTRKIGRKSSNGCVGLYNEHIEELFEMAKVGTQVLLI